MSVVLTTGGVVEVSLSYSSRESVGEGESEKASVWANASLDRVLMRRKDNRERGLLWDEGTYCESTNTNKAPIRVGQQRISSSDGRRRREY